MADEPRPETAPQFDLVVISLGAGVESSALYLMACMGEFETRPAVAIFADTQVEPPWVYDQLSYLQATGGKKIPIRTVTAGNLGDTILKPRDGKCFFAVPFFRPGPSGRVITLRRQCTREYKIAPIVREVRRMCGLRKGQRAEGKIRVEQWLGISLSEPHRMRSSRLRWIENRYPLVCDKPTTRDGCIKWMRRNGHPIPGKSACICCPYRSDRSWREWKKHRPEAFAAAVQFDRSLRSLGGGYLHRSLKPLEEVEFQGDDRQLDLWGNECDGLCGL